jgi:hypothetical protein
MLTNVLQETLRNGKVSPWKIAAVIGLTSLLAACGGGGGGGGAGSDGSAAASATTPITLTETQAGDYFVYSTTQTLPTATQAQTYNETTSYLSFATDGTHQLVFTTEGAPAYQATLNANDGILGNNDAIGGTSIACPNVPALQGVPPYPRSVGQTWSSSTKQTCRTITSTQTISGEIKAREQLVTPLGTFDSYRVTRTSQFVFSSANFTTAPLLDQSTCWYEVQRGVKLRCESTYTTPSTSPSTPATTTSITTTLTGLGGPHRASLGNVLARFAGSWRVQYSGGTSGDCAQLAVTASGSISGSCTATTGASFNVTGSVNNSGAVTLALPTGGSLTGTLTTPYSGQGNWTDGSFSGTWTASQSGSRVGSGGSAVPSTTTPITLDAAQVGDYLVYSATTTQNLPTGTQTSTGNYTNSYLSIAANGTHQLATTSEAAPASQETLNANDGSVDSTETINGASVTCPYSPVLQEVPPYPRSVGQTWNSNSERTCGNATSTITVSGQILAREPLVTPAGTFDSYRVSRTSQTVMNILYVPTITISGQSTCWYEVQRGVLLQCDSTYTTTSTGSSWPTTTSSDTTTLTGLGGPNRVSLGNVLARFTGSWRVQYSGGSSGDCAQLMVTASGGIIGNCTAASGASFNVTGSVNELGAVTLALPTGGNLTGTLNTPYSGLGNWVDGSFTGTWTASHN